jgi:hypothetical protein
MSARAMLGEQRLALSFAVERERRHRVAGGTISAEAPLARVIQATSSVVSGSLAGIFAWSPRCPSPKSLAHSVRRRVQRKRHR